MVLTYSQPMSLGTQAPLFNLPDVVSGKILSFEAISSEGITVVMFICNHCPFVQHIEKELVKVAAEYQSKGISFVAISSNDAEQYPQDAPELMKQRAMDLGYTFPYLYDESQEIAKKYDAKCTPEFYIFGKDKKCIYHGRFDESSPGKSIPVTGEDLRGALEAALQGEIVGEQFPSVGCNVKWK